MFLSSVMAMQVPMLRSQPADAGAKVLILEKTAAGGGNVSVSSGWGLVVPTNKQDYYKISKKRCMIVSL